MGLLRCDTEAAYMVAVLLLVLAAAHSVLGQQTDPSTSCVDKLVPCASYINSTNPPESCCGPMRDAVKEDFQCLCNVYSSPLIFTSLGINFTEALELPKHCGIKKSVDECQKEGRPPPAKTPNTTAAGATAPSGDGSAACRGAGGIGFSSLMSLHMMWAAMAL